MINGVHIGAMDIVIVSAKVIAVSVVIGLIVGYIAVLIMRLPSDPMSELVLI
jgi:type III secretory pathway component EscS